MNASEVINFITDLEKRYPVEEWKIEDIHIWPILRIKLMYALGSLNLDRHPREETPEKNKKSAQFLKNLNYVNFISDIFAYGADYHNNDWPHSADAIFLTHSTSRLFSIKGKKYDVWFDPIITKLHNENLSTFSMEIAPGNEYRIPRFNRSMFIEPYLRIMKVKSLLFWPDLQPVNLHTYESFMHEIQEKRIDARSLSIESTLKQFHLILLISKFFKKILAKVKPKIGFLVNYYSSVGMAFNLACKEAGIISCEVQHGTINDYHCAYSRWSKIPEGGFALLPKMFWTWSKKEKAIIDSWHSNLSSEDMVLTGSNLLIDSFKRGEDELTQESQNKIKALKAASKMETHILLTLVSGQQISLMILNILTQFSDRFFWWIRLHPAMASERKSILDQLRQCGIKNWDLDNATELPLYAILLNVDIHVTSFSSVVIEAEQFGVPSLIMTKLGEEYFHDSIARGVAHTFFSEKSFEKMVETLKNKRETMKVNEWQPYSQQAMQRIFTISQKGI